MAARQTALRALGLLDLTSLGDEDDERVLEALCARALTPHGQVAAVCVWSRFVPLCKTRLRGSGVRVAAVANFPAGGTDIDAAVEDTRRVVTLGGDEVDLVLPYHSWLAGDRTLAKELVAACREACGPEVALKVILETGCLRSVENIAAASRDAIDAGANFIKTSTGKTAVSATPEAARAMLETIRDSGQPVGFKASGGIRDTTQAESYLALADQVMGPDWACAGTFRIGASSLLDDLVATLEGRTGKSSREGY